MQAQLIVKNPLHILLIAVPLIIQTILIFALSYCRAKVLKLPYNIAAPAGFIGASNFFELAVAISLFPLNPAVSLATVVGVLVEVPVMLMLVKVANKTKGWFKTKGNTPPTSDNGEGSMPQMQDVDAEATLIGETND